VLARETSLVVVAGLAAVALWRLLSRGPDGNRRALAWLMLPAAAGAVWQLVLLQVWGVLPVRSGSSTNLRAVPVLPAAGRGDGLRRGAGVRTAAVSRI
jgi:hypothetical protein